ncbi:ral guanine nucleotide dissociation stimulator-like [Eschrichtius robustus]|uniref:ral guanine nucleotide dissociation stimulator-like n=1 Tax=Eschrichtius robustus TaxID=9764 RepID=UPI0035C0B839
MAYMQLSMLGSDLEPQAYLLLTQPGDQEPRRQSRAQAPLPSRGEAGSSASCCTISRPRSSCITAVPEPAPERPSKNKANVTGRKTTEPGKAFLRTQSQRKVTKVIF